MTDLLYILFSFFRYKTGEEKMNVGVKEVKMYGKSIVIMSLDPERLFP